jgi:hypothetical protein
MRDLNYQLKLLCRHSHEGSFKTRAPLKTARDVASR